MSDSARQNSKPIRVLHLIDSLDISGGAERQLAANLQNFDHDLINHEVAVIKESASSRLDEVTPFVSVYPIIPEGANPTRRRIVAGLRALVRQRRPTLLHASLPDSALAARIVSRLEGVKAVESLVNISHEPIRTVDNPNVTAPKLAFHRMLDRITMSWLVGYHAVSQAVADSWAEFVGLDRRKIEVIPRGIDIASLQLDIAPDEARQSLLEEFGLPDDSIIALSVGRIEPQKGHRYLIEAVAQIVQVHPNIRVLIVGRSGNSSPSVETLIRREGLDDVVTLTGSRRDLPRFLAAADLFVFPSLFEGNGGNAMIEAMAAGLPIITTDAAPMTDLIPNSEVGLLVGRCDSPGLSTAMARLADDAELRRRLGAAARERARTFLSPSEVAARHQRWYQELASTIRATDL